MFTENLIYIQRLPIVAQFILYWMKSKSDITKPPSWLITTRNLSTRYLFLKCLHRNTTTFFNNQAPPSMRLRIPKILFSHEARTMMSRSESRRKIFCTSAQITWLDFLLSARVYKWKRMLLLRSFSNEFSSSRYQVPSAWKRIFQCDIPVFVFWQKGALNKMWCVKVSRVVFYVELQILMDFFCVACEVGELSVSCVQTGKSYENDKILKEKVFPNFPQVN